MQKWEYAEIEVYDDFIRYFQEGLFNPEDIIELNPRDKIDKTKWGAFILRLKTKDAHITAIHVSNTLGKNGWEAVNFFDHNYQQLLIFKRPLEDSPS